MRHVRMLGLCLVAAFALGAVFAVGSAAAAEPEWAGCLKLPKAKGNYTEEKCETVAGKTKKGVFTPDHKGAYEFEVGTCYEIGKGGNYTESECKTVAGKTKKGVFTPDHKGKWEKAPQDKFTGAGGAGVLSTFATACVFNEEHESENLHAAPREDCAPNASGSGVVLTVECTSENASGEATGTSEVQNVSVRFKGCTSLESPATSKGLPAGEIQVNSLKGRLGYINKANHEVGVLLEPATAGGQFVEFEALENEAIIHVGEGNPTQGSFWEKETSPRVWTAGTPTGNDGIISPITPVNQETRTFTQDYRVEQSSIPCPSFCGHAYSTQTTYLNIPDHFEGGQFEGLETKVEGKETGESFQWSSAMEEITNVNTVASGYAEIKA